MPNGEYSFLDYTSLLNDREFENMLSFRVALRRVSTEHKKRTIEITQKTIQAIVEELENRK